MTSVPDGIETIFDIERIVVNLTISGVTCRVQWSHIFVLTDIITECIVNRISSTEHDGTCGISVAVVVLIVCSVTIVSIPRLSIAITTCGIQCFKTFIILENRIFTFPWPDTCCHTSCPNILFSDFITICIQSWLLLCIICCINLFSCVL